MDSTHKDIFNKEFQPQPPIKNQQNSTYQPPLPNSHTGFPILAIAVVGILATAFLLVSYYIFVTKRCLNWQQLDPLRSFSIMRARRNEDPLMAYSPSLQNHRLDELLIREIPTFQYSRGEGEERSLHKSVILGTMRNLNDQIVAPTSSPQDPQPFIDGLMGLDEDFVVTELSGEDGTVILPHRQQERDESRVLMQSRNYSPRKLEQKPGMSKPRKFHHVSMMGDECIDVRESEDCFSIQPIRRSFSMDSAADRHIYLSVQEIIQQNSHVNAVRNSEECSSRVRTSFLSFGHGRGSRSAVLPIESDL
ncbi:hypothetical protein F0562_002447 [Nyssa sinensis]|uniref:RING-type E3 ubiquitin transferase n=1 Tax=Nyssa sinensis TaxID=561372 RepID=A0A5J5C5W6_9ASTE|nr:hypothetical protein F0562_002447 [Nyssa sinensis]